MTAVGVQERTARRSHLCDYCGEEIPRGQRYRRWAWVDGHVCTVRAHLACDDLAAAAAEEEEYEVSAETLHLALDPYLDEPETLPPVEEKSGWPKGEAQRLLRWGTPRREAELRHFRRFWQRDLAGDAA